MITQAFPSPLEHDVPPVTSPDGDPREPADLRPGRPAGRRGRQDHHRPVRRAHLAGPGLLRHPAAGLRPCTSPGHFLAERGHEDHDVDEKVGALTSPLGKTQRTVAQCIAGDICAVAKLSRAETGDTLSAKDEPLLMEPWLMPEPLLPVAVVAKSKADEDKLAQGLGRLVAEDPTLRLENNSETHQLVLWCMGEAHLDVLLDRLRNRYGVDVESVPLRVQLRETFAGKANGHGRHVKQSGGHGQYAVCDIEVEPLPSGGGFEFVDKVVGGAVPRQFIPSVEKGVRTQMERGVAAGYPVVDIKVTLIDGKAHSVDSSDMAFQTAGRAGAQGGGQGHHGAHARAGRRAVGAGLRRVRRRGDERPVDAARPGHRHRAGRQRPVTGEGRGAAGRDHPVRRRPAVALARHRHVLPRPTSGTTRCRPQLAAKLQAEIGRRLTCDRRGVSRGQASASRSRVSASSCGITLVPASTVMKLASPPQRGTTCWCRWSASEPPAT